MIIKALSIMQPWPWLIVRAGKDIENRGWPTRYRGPVFLHAGQKMDTSAWGDLALGRHPVTGQPFPRHLVPDLAQLQRGGVIGIADIVDCVERHDSPWFVGKYGFVLANARPLPFMLLTGQLGFFNVPPAVAAMAKTATAQPAAMRI